MEKVYVIGAGKMTDAELIAKAALAADTEIIRVNSQEDVPIVECLRSDVNPIIEIDKLRSIPEFAGYEESFKPTHKGHERPYKYHR